jgi:acetyltransferase-like isoleucine patch superfamily enzyme
MNFDKLRPLWLRVRLKLVFFGRDGRPKVVLGRRCRIEKGCEIKVAAGATLAIEDRGRVRGGCRFDLTKQSILTLGERSEVRHFSIIECGGVVSVGARSVIGAYNWLQGTGNIEIGSDVIIGPGVRIISTTHDTSNPDLPFSQQPLICSYVRIANNVWIGADVVILSGVSIGKNVIIGAGSLVSRDLAENGVYVGVPARRVKDVLSTL